jgi:hypothetical protein
MYQSIPVNLSKPLKQPRETLRGNPDAFVGDSHRHLPPGPTPWSRDQGPGPDHCSLIPILRELDGVVQEPAQHADEHELERSHRRQGLIDSHPYLQALVSGPPFELPRCVMHDLLQTVMDSGELVELHTESTVIQADPQQ